jgi:hypothetical protein
MPHILSNGTKYELLDFETEKEFEEAVIANSRHLFGEDAIYVDLKRKMGTGSTYHKGIPDGYVIDFADLRQPQLYFVENELSSHDVYGHITEQIARFGTLAVTSKGEIREKLLVHIRSDKALKEEVEEKIVGGPFHNLDHLMNFLTERSTIRIVVVIDDETPDLNLALNIFRQRPDVVTLQRYAAGDALIFLYQPMREESLQAETFNSKKPAVEFDTVVCAAFADGVKQAYQEQGAWWAIRLSQEAREHLHYLAIYEKSPIGEVKHVAEIDHIEPYKDSGKYIVYLKNKHEIKPVKLDSPSRRGVAPQGPRFTTYEKLLTAKKLSELWQ